MMMMMNEDNGNEEDGDCEDGDEDDDEDASFHLTLSPLLTMPITGPRPVMNLLRMLYVLKYMCRTGRQRGDRPDGRISVQDRRTGEGTDLMQDA